MINLKDPKTYRALDNSKNQFINRLTVFRDGEIRIEEIHEWKKGSISRQEVEGNAMSIQIPDNILKREIPELAEKLIPLVDNWDTEAIRDEILEFRLAKNMKV